jgi:hypothetical protein
MMFTARVLLFIRRAIKNALPDRQIGQRKEGEPFMDTDNSHLDPIYERFNQAIMSAIVNSREVKDLLKEIGDQGYINESSVFNLFLSLEELDEYINSKPPNSNPTLPHGLLEGLQNGEADPDAIPKPGGVAPSRIDGRRLTDAEAQFLEYCARHFDEQQWLKKARLKL